MMDHEDLGLTPEQMADLVARVTILETDNATLRADNATLRDRVTRLEERVTRLTSTVAAYAAANVAVWRRVTELETANTSLTERVAELETRDLEVGYYRERFPCKSRVDELYNQSCPICLEDFAEGFHRRLASCGHVYHDACWAVFLPHSINGCSICRQPTGPSQRIHVSVRGLVSEGHGGRKAACAPE